MKLTDRPTPETDAIQGNGIHQVTDAFDHARKLERERDYAIRLNNTLRMDMDGLAHEICQLQDSLGCPCETDNAQEKAMERLRDLIAAEGELGDAKEKIEKLEAECTRLHRLWHTAEEKANVANAEIETARLALSNYGAAFAADTLTGVVVRTIEVLDAYRQNDPGLATAPQDSAT